MNSHTTIKNTERNWYQLQSAFYKLSIQYKIDLSCQSMFTALLYKANILFFPDTMEIFNSELCHLLGIEDRSMRRIRERLIEARLTDDPNSWIIKYMPRSTRECGLLQINYSLLMSNGDYGQFVLNEHKDYGQIVLIDETADRITDTLVTINVENDENYGQIVPPSYPTDVRQISSSSVFKGPGNNNTEKKFEKKDEEEEFFLQKRKAEEILKKIMADKYTQCVFMDEDLKLIGQHEELRIERVTKTGLRRITNIKMIPEYILNGLLNYDSFYKEKKGKRLNIPPGLEEHEKFKQEYETTDFEAGKKQLGKIFAMLDEKEKEDGE